MTNCIQCGFQNVPGKQFCGGCGASTVGTFAPAIAGGDGSSYGVYDDGGGGMNINSGAPPYSPPLPALPLPPPPAEIARPLHVVETRAAIAQPTDFDRIINQAVVPAHPREREVYADSLTIVNMACVGTVLASNLVSAMLGQLLHDDAFAFGDDDNIGFIIFDWPLILLAVIPFSCLLAHNAKSTACFHASCACCCSNFALWKVVVAMIFEFIHIGMSSWDVGRARTRWCYNDYSNDCNDYTTYRDLIMSSCNIALLAIGIICQIVALCKRYCQQYCVNNCGCCSTPLANDEVAFLEG